MTAQREVADSILAMDLQRLAEHYRRELKQARETGSSEAVDLYERLMNAALDDLAKPQGLS